MANKKVRIEGNKVVFEDLGIYSDNPIEDQLINEKLLEYLKSMGYEMPKIKLDVAKVKPKNRTKVLQNNC